VDFLKEALSGRNRFVLRVALVAAQLAQDSGFTASARPA
jgi:hypothetical protein